MDSSARARLDAGASAPVSRDQALDAACWALWRETPWLSARSRRSAGALLLVAIAVVAGALPFVSAPLARPFYDLLLLGFAGLCAVRVAAAGELLQRPDEAISAARVAVEDLPLFTILCPLRAEPAVVAQLANAIRNIDYPRDRLDCKLLLEADDLPTIIAARRDAPDFEIILTPPSAPRTKPKALNFGLASARGEFLTVFDAEDIPHPRQLRDALDAFRADTAGDLGVVQAPLLIDNGSVNWLATQFEVEYTVHFLGVMPLMARLKLAAPLGGTSNHLRVAALRDAGGWDPFNVTEDADLGFRLARRGWRIGGIRPPTYEEAPVRVWAWMRQRSRWLKGYLQSWLVLMRRPRAACRELGVASFVAANAVLLGAPLAALSYAPLTLWMAMRAFVLQQPVPAPDLALFLFGYAAGLVSGLAAAARRRKVRLALAGLTAPLYWSLAFAPALMALWELVVSPHSWRKTEHGASPREAMDCN